MEENNDQTGDHAQGTNAAQVIKKIALPFSVVLASWFCGIIACGVTCSVLVSPVHVIPREASGNMPMLYWLGWSFAIIIGVWAGLHIGKDVRSRYRIGIGRKEHSVHVRNENDS